MRTLCIVGRVVLLNLACLLLVSAASCASLPLEGPAASQPATSQPTVTTIVLVRHGERDEGFNPPLNEAGRARAQALVEALGENGVTVIYAPALIRNMETAQPLADHLGLSINQVALIRLVNPETLADELATEFLDRHAGQVILYVGNDSNLEPLYYRLGGTGRPPVRHEDLYTIVVREDGRTHFIKAKYGETR